MKSVGYCGGSGRNDIMRAMTFEDVVAILERTFKLELKVVEGTTVFEVASEDGGTKVKVLMQNVGEHNKVLLSADLCEPPQGGSKALFRTMLEANNLFGGTAGATLALDSASGRCRLQKYEPSDEFANDPANRLETFIETALNWSRMIADHRPEHADEDFDPGEMRSVGAFTMVQV